MELPSRDSSVWPPSVSSSGCSGNSSSAPLANTQSFRLVLKPEAKLQDWHPTTASHALPFFGYACTHGWTAYRPLPSVQPADRAMSRFHCLDLSPLRAGRRRPVAGHRCHSWRHFADHPATINWLLRYLSATLVAVIRVVEPIRWAVLAYFFKEESPAPAGLIGGTLILARIFLTSRQNK